MVGFITVGIGVWQIVVIFLIVLLLFGGSKFPELMRGVGQGMQEFKKATAENADDEIIVDDEEDTKKVKDGKK